MTVHWRYTDDDNCTVILEEHVPHPARWPLTISGRGEEMVMVVYLDEEALIHLYHKIREMFPDRFDTLQSSL